MSDELFHNFQTAHQSIVDTLGQTQLLLRTYFKAKPKIRELSQKLLAHFSRQNSAFYDELREIYEGNRQSLKIIDFLAHDLKETKIKYVEFIEKHSGEMDDINAKTFPVDFMNFSRMILTRINIEEEYLLPLIRIFPSK